MAKCFLTDFGSTVEKIDVRTRVRQLQPKEKALEPPMAFKIILEGLYPVSMVLYFFTNYTK